MSIIVLFNCREIRTRSVAEEGLLYPPPEGVNLIKHFLIRFQGEDYGMKNFNTRKTAGNLIPFTNQKL
jgi:hypothetical protein